MENRNSYLINRSLNRFLMASIASMTIMSIKGMVDSVLMGQLIGPEAVSAVQNAVPVMGFIACISILFSSGASIVATKALGRRDFDEACSSIMVAVSCCLGFVLLIAILSGMLSPRLCALLCQDAALYENTYKYLSVMMSGAFLPLLLNGMAVLIAGALPPRWICGRSRVWCVTPPATPRPTGLGLSAAF